MSIVKVFTKHHQEDLTLLGPKVSTHVVPTPTVNQTHLP